MKINSFALGFYTQEELLARQLQQKKLGEKISKVLERGIFSRAEQKDLSKDFGEALPGLVSSLNFEGAGFHNVIYSIDDNFVIKVCRHFNSKSDVGKNPTFMFMPPPIMEFERYAGSEIATYGNVMILRNLGEHTQAGVPQPYWTRLLDNEMQEYYSEKYLPEFANVPQESFDILVRNSSKLNNLQLDGHNVSFDFVNPNNIVKKKDELWFVDTLDCDEKVKKTTAQNFIEMLLCKLTSSDYCKGYTQNGAKSALVMLKKILMASVKEELHIVPEAGEAGSLYSVFNPMKEVFSHIGLWQNPEEVAIALEDLGQKKVPVSEKLQGCENVLNQLV